MRPSIRSRSRSAWPLCRAYSSIMCTSTQRSDSTPLRRRPARRGRSARSRSARRTRSPLARPRTPRRPRPGRRRRRRSRRPARVGAIERRAVEPAIRPRNQTAPPRPCAGRARAGDSPDGSTDRRASCSASSPSHLISASAAGHAGSRPASRARRSKLALGARILIGRARTCCTRLIRSLTTNYSDVAEHLRRLFRHDVVDEAPMADSEPARYFSLSSARRMVNSCRCR